MTFEQILDLYLAVEKAYSVSPEAVAVAEKAYQSALAESDFTDSMFYDECVLEGLFED